MLLLLCEVICRTFLVLTHLTKTPTDIGHIVPTSFLLYPLPTKLFSSRLVFSSPVWSILLYSISFSSILLFNSILFCFVPFYCGLFHNVSLNFVFYSILFFLFPPVLWCYAISFFILLCSFYCVLSSYVLLISLLYRSVMFKSVLFYFLCFCSVFLLQSGYLRYICTSGSAYASVIVFLVAEVSCRCLMLLRCLNKLSVLPLL